MSDGLPADVVKLLDARALRLAAPPRVLESEGDAVWFATFPVGDLEVAIPLGELRAALPLRRVTPVPLAPPEIVGIVRFSGMVLTVYSLAFLLGGQGSRTDSHYLIVTERSPGRLIVFDCAQIPLATTRPAREVELARARGTGAVVDLPKGNQVLSMVDLPKLLTEWEARRGA